MLPALQKPKILDIGCGSGLPTVELARLSDGVVVGVDIDENALDRMRQRASRLGLSNRVKALRCSMTEMEFADGSFDIVWSEGAIWLVGFEQGLRAWRRLIRPSGYLVVHEMCWLEADPPDPIREYWNRIYPGMATYEEHLGKAEGCGYDLLGGFPLPQDAWWDFYFGPLSQRISNLRAKHVHDTDALSQLDDEERQVTFYRRYSKWYGSAFYVMRRQEAYSEMLKDPSPLHVTMPRR